MIDVKKQIVNDYINGKFDKIFDLISSIEIIEQIIDIDYLSVTNGQIVNRIPNGYLLTLKIGFDIQYFTEKYKKIASSFRGKILVEDYFKEYLYQVGPFKGVDLTINWM